MIRLLATLTALLVVLPAFAVPAGGQPAAQPMPPLQPQPTTVPGRPDIPNAEVNTLLRSIAPPPLPMTEDQLPIPQLKLPKGFKIEVFASGIANARTLRLGDKGTVFVSNRLLDKVYAIVERNGKREIKILASAWTGPTVWPSTRARCTSPKAPRFPSWRGSRTTSAIRPSPSSSTTICRTINRTAGGTSASGQTRSSTSTSVRRATSASRLPPTRRSDGSTSMAAAPKSTRAASGIPWVSTGIR